MAHVNATHAGHAGFAERIAALVEGLRTAMAKRAIYRKTVRELGALSGRELADLGIHRSGIRRLATEAAYGK